MSLWHAYKLFCVFIALEIIIEVIEISVIRIVYINFIYQHYLPLYSSGGSGFGSDFTAC